MWTTIVNCALSILIIIILFRAFKWRCLLISLYVFRHLFNLIIMKIISNIVAKKEAFVLIDSFETVVWTAVLALGCYAITKK